MSEGASASASVASAAPASAPQSSGPANDNQASTPKPGPGQLAEAPSAPAWGENDDKELFERLKRSPYKTKFKGQERAIESKDAMREFLSHAQRGIGASKVVEETKAEREAAARELAEAKRERQLIERAKAGDWNARKELNLLDPAEVRRKNDEWEAVPPEVRELYEREQRASKERDELRTKLEERERIENDRREAAALSQAKRVAMTETNRVLHAIGMTEANQERLMPFVAGAIADLREHGLEIGVDMPAEMIVARFKELVGDFEAEMFGGLSRERSIPMIEKQLESLDDENLLKAFSPKFAARLSKAFARSLTARRQQSAQGNSITRTSEAEEKPKPPSVLPFYRFQR